MSDVELQCIAKEMVDILAEKKLTIREAIRIAEIMLKIIEYEAKLKPLKSG